MSKKPEDKEDMKGAENKAPFPASKDKLKKAIDKAKKKVASKGDSPSKKGATPEITDPVKVNFEPNEADLFGAMDEEIIHEVMSVAARLKRKQQMRRYKARMQISRKRALRRRATTSKIKVRARRSALSGVKKKLAGGRSARNLSYSERARVERLAKRRKGIVQRTARRLVIAKRTQERNRLSRRR